MVCWRFMGKYEEALLKKAAFMVVVCGCSFVSILVHDL
jgi:hypothetical protein